MRLLHVNNVDLHGKAFNGYDLLTDMVSRGFESEQAVLWRASKNDDVFPLMRTYVDDQIHQALCRMEKRHSMNNLLFPWGRVLAETKQFERADLVHYHLLHNQVVSLFDLEALFAAKPSVWTFHDPWPMTGHCLYPLDCTKWKDGCNGCPALDVAFPMDEDCAGRMWQVKKRVYSNLDVDIVVASEFMRDMVRSSPLTSHFERVHLVPFGIDTSIFPAPEEQKKVRTSLGVPENDFVILFRSTESQFKGLPAIIEALKMHAPRRSTTLLTVDTKGLITALSSDYNVMEFGWIHDRDLYPRIVSACDLLLMPSTAEAFGLMALEAMAAGRTVVSFEGTSLSSVTQAPEIGIAVHMGDAAALRAVVDRLSTDADELGRRGAAGRELVEREYTHDHYLDRLAGIYRGAVERRG